MPTKNVGGYTWWSDTSLLNGDYAGTGLIARSNKANIRYRLESQNEWSPFPIIQEFHHGYSEWNRFDDSTQIDEDIGVVTTTGDYGTEQMWLRTDRWSTLIKRLENYQILDEDAYSLLQMEAQDRELNEWAQNGYRDLLEEDVAVWIEETGDQRVEGDGGEILRLGGEIGFRFEAEAIHDEIDRGGIELREEYDQNYLHVSQYARERINDRFRAALQEWVIASLIEGIRDSRSRSKIEDWDTDTRALLANLSTRLQSLGLTEAGEIIDEQLGFDELIPTQRTFSLVHVLDTHINYLRQHASPSDIEKLIHRIGGILQVIPGLEMAGDYLVDARILK